jgi:hypothetical protein
MDKDDEILKLRIGDVISRKGRQWRVNNIQTTSDASLPKPVDIVRVFLVSA